MIPTDFSDGAFDDDGMPTISAPLLGFMSSCYQLGSILGVPIAPYVNQTWGRRWSVMGGSLILCVGAIIQGFAQHGTSIYPLPELPFIKLTVCHKKLQSECISSHV